MSSCQYKKRISDDSESEYKVEKYRQQQQQREQRGGVVWKMRWWIILVILLLVLYYVYTHSDTMGLTQLSPKIAPNEIDIRTDNAVQEIRRLFQ